MFHPLSLSLVTHGKDQSSAPMCLLTAVYSSVANHTAERPLGTGEWIVRSWLPTSTLSQRLSLSLSLFLVLSLWRINSVIFVSRCAHLYRSLTSTSAFIQHFQGGKLLSSRFGFVTQTLITSRENSCSSSSAVWNPLRSAHSACIVTRQVNDTVWG